MKTTIDIDDPKLTAAMRLTGARSRKAAVDYSLTCAERGERLRLLFEEALPDEACRTTLDPAYDLAKVRRVVRLEVVRGAIPPAVRAELPEMGDR